MTDYKHTQGPWDVPSMGFVLKGGVIYPIAPDETRLDCESWLDMRRRIKPLLEAREAEARANAHLIAAAPEMYEALHLVLDIDDDGAGLWPAQEAARTAIAKARGGN